MQEFTVGQRVVAVATGEDGIIKRLSASHAVVWFASDTQLSQEQTIALEDLRSAS